MCRTAIIRGTGIVVITYNGCVDALVSGAGIRGATAVIVTNHRCVRARAIAARIGSTAVIVAAIYLRKLAVTIFIAFIYGASIIIITA